VRACLDPLGTVKMDGLYPRETWRSLPPAAARR